MKAIWRNLPALISLALLAAAIAYISRQQDRLAAIVTAWRHIGLLEILGATAFMIATQLVIAWRCSLIYERNGLARPNLFLSNARLQLIALFASHGAVVPGFADVAKGTLIKLRFGVPVTLAMKLVVYERICTAAGIMMVGVLVLPLSFFYHLPPSLVLVPAAMWLGGLTGLALLIWLGQRHISTGQPTLDRLVRGLTDVGDLYRDRRTFVLLLVSAIVQIGLIDACFLLLAHGMALPIAPTIIFLFVPFIVFVFSLPVFYLGWGGREAMVIMTIGSVAHLATADALALSAAYGVIVLLAAVPGAVFWLLRPSMRKSGETVPLPAALDQPSA